MAGDVYSLRAHPEEFPSSGARGRVERLLLAFSKCDSSGSNRSCDLESFGAFPAWDVTAARAAVGTEQPSDPRIA